jgi:hypothetical protein
MEQELSMAEAALKFGNDSAPFTTNPISDASIIIACFIDHTLHYDKLSTPFKALQKGQKEEDSTKGNLAADPED